jgi:hypothetical protein
MGLTLPLSSGLVDLRCRLSAYKLCAKQAGSISTSTSSVRFRVSNPSPFYASTLTSPLLLLCHFPSSSPSVTRPFTPLLPFQTVLGMEASPDSRRTALEPAGLCNAVILSQPDARFLDRWLDAYKDFDSAGWADFSVKKPWVRSSLFSTCSHLLLPPSLPSPLFHSTKTRKADRETFRSCQRIGWNGCRSSHVDTRTS